MIVVGSPDIRVINGALLFGSLWQGLLIQPGFQDRLDALVREGIDKEGPLAGGFKPFISIRLAKAHDAETRSKPLLRMRAAGHDRGKKIGCGRACLLGPADDSRRGPLKMPLVRLGHVRFDRGVGSLEITSHMARLPFPFVEDLHDHRGQADIHRLSDQPVRDAVVMIQDLHVIVDVDLSLLPFAVLIGRGRQRLQSRFVQFLEQGSPAAGKFFEGAIIERFE